MTDDLEYKKAMAFLQANEYIYGLMLVCSSRFQILVISRILLPPFPQITY